MARPRWQLGIPCGPIKRDCVLLPATNLQNASILSIIYAFTYCNYQIYISLTFLFLMLINEALLTLRERGSGASMDTQ